MATMAGAAVTITCSYTSVPEHRFSSRKPANTCALRRGRPLRQPISQKVFNRTSPNLVRAMPSTDESSTSSSVQTEELLADLKAKWDAIEDKTNVFIYGGGALVALWLSSTIIGAVNSVPLLPKLLELLGLAYTGWFVYRYLLFKDNRKELIQDIEDLKSKITGNGKE
ncbi:hypothetical protein KP509_30G007200 [Ceratopteris richardii]|uniref:Cyanobacterial aminoacyl-tRNA synthetase CAAD domain-containing protein n=2 Tax=Ceratopteris richardii TaxID=49495 RepID=A0A8T2R1B7_CERRI|nr:hypothetical protein KP509_30G007200 [Ceratopteris richardii]